MASNHSHRLFLETLHNNETHVRSNVIIKKRNKVRKTNKQFQQFFFKCDDKYLQCIPQSLLPVPCMKGDKFAITILEDEYKLDL